MGLTKRLQEDIEAGYAYDHQFRSELEGTEKEYDCPIDFKKFTIRELRNHIGNQWISIQKQIDIEDDDILSIPEAFELSSCRGNENLYFTIRVFKENEYVGSELRFWTKDNHDELKQLVLEIFIQI